MPLARADVQTTKRFDLKSLAEAYVVLKRMSYGESVQRRTMMKLSVAASKGRSFQGELAMGSLNITAFEYAHCVVEHNLEKDESGTLFNFNDPKDVEILDSKVGQEIEGYMSDMNNFEDDDSGD